ncbi:MAG TPA: hypothetical protein VNQ55_00440 [Parapedobacter sp.]|nr:hypothetical protein [Parapedobacter sp.]
MFSSCFQVIEEITVNSDGSGTLMLTANLSQSRSKLASVMLLDSVNGHKVPSRQEIQEKMEEASNTLRAVKGISKVSHSVDFDKYILNIRFSFENVSNLNDITALIFNKLDVKTTDNSSYSYHPQSKTFTRHYAPNPQAKSEYQKLKQVDKAIFEGATYTNIYRFEHSVIKQSNSKAKVAASRRAVMLQCGVLDLIEGKINISNNIQLAQ